MIGNITDRLIIQWTCAGTSLCLLPLIILRVAQSEWMIATINTTAAMFSVALFLHVYLTQNTKVARIGISILALSVLTSTVVLKGSEQLLWLYPVITVVFYLLKPKLALFITSAFTLLITGLVIPESGLMFLYKFVFSSMATVVFCFAFSTKTRTQAKTLSELALNDMLTGAGNRRALSNKISEVCARLDRYPHNKCSLIIFDLDHFKKINDTFGHNFGDVVLQTFVQLVKNRIRSSDYIYRFGGEEFVLVLENTDIMEAMSVAKILGKELELVNWEYNHAKVTVSAGVAQHRSKDTVHDWLNRADNALYKAKQTGRNCCLANESDALTIVRKIRKQVA